MEVMKISAVNSGFRGDCANNFSPKTNPAKNFRGETRLSNPTTQNLQAYYLTKQPSFGRLTVEHLEHGAYVDEAKNVIFNLFTFKEVKQVFVEIENKATIELKRLEGEAGIFAKKVGPNIVKHGDRYRFILDYGNGKTVPVIDPYAMRRDSVIDTFSYVYDHHQFPWSKNERAWVEGKDCRRLSRRKDAQNKIKLNDLVIQKIHIPTLTKEGTFEAAKAEIDEIVKKGFNAIEIMPVENLASFNWGYDGVNKMAVQESKDPLLHNMGGPDALKSIIDYAHSKGLNVGMDVVPNHMGPDGNFMKNAGPYLGGPGEFGDTFNFENDPANNPKARDYVSDMCLNWLRNYHCDFLRLDMTKYMASDNALKQIAMEVHYHHPDVVLIAEDGRQNYWNLTRELTKDEEAIGKPEEEHAAQIKRVDRNHISLDNLGLDSEWDFPFLHSLEDALGIKPNDNEEESYAKLEKFSQYTIHSGSRIKFFQSHDEIGNADGIRLITKLVRDKLGIFSRIQGKDDCEKGQRAAQVTQSILTSKVCGEYDTFSDGRRLEFLRDHYINGDVTPKEVEDALNYAVMKHKLGLGQIFTAPGPKMLFQGDEEANLSPFKFFREFSSLNAKTQDENILRKSKGYEPGYEAFMTSKLDRIPYAYEYKKTMSKVKKYTQDLSTLSNKIPALNSGNTESIMTYGGSKIQARHLKNGKSEVFVVSNFDGFSYVKGEYGIHFPEGKWEEVFNGNKEKYGGDGKGSNKGKKFSGGAQSISIPCDSVLIFKKVGG